MQEKEKKQTTRTPDIEMPDARYEYPFPRTEEHTFTVADGWLDRPYYQRPS